MPNPFRRCVRSTGPLVSAVLLCLFCLPVGQAAAQTPTTVTPLDRQLSRIDFGVSAAGTFSSTVHGTNYVGVAISDRPSSTIGPLVTLRYTAKPYVGFEFNFSQFRLTQDFISNPTYLPGGAQATQAEFSLGYVAHIPHKIFGIQPFVGAGAGSIRFRPTPFGGQGLPFQYRAAYYYTAGLETNFPDSHFGVRLGFRQLIYLAPDFQQNYLTITRRTLTSEPNVGFFVRF